MKRLIFFSMLILLVSCDPETTENYVIDNRTKYDITFKFNITKWTGAETELHELVVKSNNSAFLYQDETIMAFLSNKGDNFLYQFDTITSHINDTVSLIKDINDCNNWNFNKAHGRSIDDNCHIFIIRESDLKR